MDSFKQDNSYLIVLRPEYVIERFEKKEQIQRHCEEYRQLRKTYSVINPLEYRGISREVLGPYVSYDRKMLRWYEQQDITDCGLARLRLQEIQQDLIKCNRFDPSSLHWFGNVSMNLLRSYDDVEDVLSLINDTSFFEVIFVRQNMFDKNSLTMGFDIGYLGNDPFSIIADIAVIPQWHPTDPNDDQDVVSFFKRLNKHILFEDAESAQEFLDYYRTRTWAETEDIGCEFYVIQVDKVDFDGN